ELAPLLSVALYVTSYFPATLLLTSFLTTSILLIFPSSASVAVTPSNGLNSSPNCITISLAFITGILLIDSILGFTTTTLCFIVVLLPLSVALYVTLYTPAIFVFTLLSTTNSISLSSSITSTPSLGSNSSPTVKV